jgi:hypothetical protein
LSSSRTFIASRSLRVRDIQATSAGNIRVAITRVCSPDHPFELTLIGIEGLLIGNQLPSEEGLPLELTIIPELGTNGRSVVLFSVDRLTTRNGWGLFL